MRPQTFQSRGIQPRPGGLAKARLPRLRRLRNPNTRWGRLLRMVIARRSYGDWATREAPSNWAVRGETLAGKEARAIVPIKNPMGAQKTKFYGD